MFSGFHWTRFTGFESGYIIRKGHWGTAIDSRPVHHRQAAKEWLYEYIRRTEFPHRPSRLNCTFFCGNIESAYAFAPNRKNHTLYEVKVCDESAKIFSPNWDMQAQSAASLEEVYDCARDYWKALNVPPQLQEVVVESDVEVIRRMELPPDFWK